VVNTRVEPFRRVEKRKAKCPRGARTKEEMGGGEWILGEGRKVRYGRGRKQPKGYWFLYDDSP